MILLIDNYDSFVHNLARYLRQLGTTTEVVRNDSMDVNAIRNMQPSAIVLSPGPCGPAQAGNSLQIVKELYQEFPMLGICLGHQVIVEALGGSVIRATHPVHGQASPTYHGEGPPFQRIPNPFPAARYHSLIADRASLPSCLGIDAWLKDGTIMGVRHHTFPILGWQFHPESILTPDGYTLLRDALNYLGVATSHGHVPLLGPMNRTDPDDLDWYVR